MRSVQRDKRNALAFINESKSTRQQVMFAEYQRKLVEAAQRQSEAKVLREQEAK